MDDMATKKKSAADDEGLGRQIGIRLSQEDYDRLEKLAVHLSVSAIARAALMVGLDAITEQPGILLGEKPKRR